MLNEYYFNGLKLINIIKKQKENKGHKLTFYIFEDGIEIEASVKQKIKLQTKCHMCGELSKPIIFLS